MRAADLGQAEVEDLDLAGRRPHQVVRFDVPVRHAAREGMLQGHRRLTHAIARLGDRQRASLFEVVVQGLSRNVLHDQEVQFAGLVGVVGLDDVGVRQSGDGLHLALEPLHGVGVAEQGRLDHLEGHQPAQAPVVCQVHVPHAAATQQPQHAVARMTAQRRRDQVRFNTVLVGVVDRCIAWPGSGDPRAGRFTPDLAPRQQVDQRIVLHLLERAGAEVTSGDVAFHDPGFVRRQLTQAKPAQSFGIGVGGSDVRHEPLDIGVDRDGLENWQEHRGKEHSSADGRATRRAWKPLR